MTKTTKQQRQAIKRVFDRKPDEAQSYKHLRAKAQPTFGCDGAVVLPWAGMWLCIERDGYCHS